MGFFSNFAQVKTESSNANTSAVNTTPVEAPTPAPAPVQSNTPSHPSRTENKKGAYVAPADAHEAKERIQKCIDGNSVVKMETDDKSHFCFVGNTYGLRTELRMLGGEFNKDSNLWMIPVSAWNDPSTAIATKSDKQIAYEQKQAEAAAKAEAEKAAAINAAVAAVTPEGMITIEQAKANTKKALQMFLQSLASTKPETLDKIVERTFAA